MLAATVLGCILLLFGAGCKSTPSVDWDSRLGDYTYDQAVTDLGVPDKTTELSDGRRLAEWITHRSSGGSFSFEVGSYSRHTGVGLGHTVGTGERARWLRLTFDPDGRLAAWTRN